MKMFFLISAVILTISRQKQVIGHKGKETLTSIGLTQTPGSGHFKLIRKY
jgi:hypothetical protein